MAANVNVETHDAPALCVCSSITRGDYRKTWLIVDDGVLEVYCQRDGALEVAGRAGRVWDGEHLLLADVPDYRRWRTGEGTDGAQVLALPLATIQSSYIRRASGAWDLVVSSGSQAEGVTVLRVAAESLALLELAQVTLEALLQGTRPRLDPRTLPTRCPVCSAVLSGGSAICEECVDQGRLLKRMLGYAYENSRAATLLALLMIGGVGTSLLVPQITARLINNALVLHGSVSVLLVLVGASLLVQLAQQGLMAVQTAGSARLSARVLRRIRHDAWESIQRARLDEVESFPVGDLMSRLMQDTARVEVFVSGVAQQFVVQCLQFCGAFLIITLMDWKLALAVLCPLPFVLWIGHSVVPRLRRRDAYAWRVSGTLAARVADVLNGMRVVKAFGAEEAEVSRFDRINEELTSTNVAVARTWALVNPLLTTSLSLGPVLVWVVGGLAVIHGGLDLGKLVALTMYVTLVVQPVNWSARLLGEVVGAVTAAQRIFAVGNGGNYGVAVGQREAEWGSLAGDIVLDDVWFAYKKGLPVLKGVSATIPQNGVLGIIGESGSGKSTLANLLCALYTPDSGSIKVGGVSMQDIPCNVLRRSVALVPQECFLFNDTVLQNVLYGRTGAAKGEVLAAMRRASAHEFVMQLSDGYDTLLGQGGQQLSGGQRQRLTLARALLQNPSVLILDEATSALDARTEEDVRRAIEGINGNCMVIIISHHLKALESTDRLLVMREGRVLGCGTRGELLARGGAASELLVRMGGGLVEGEATSAGAGNRTDGWVEASSECKFGFREIEIAGAVDGRVCLACGGATLWVEPMRAFPLTAPDEWVALIDGDGHEVSIIENVCDVGGSAAEHLRSALRFRYFAPKVCRLETIWEGKMGAGLRVRAETDRGPVEFAIRNAMQGLRWIGQERLLFEDGRGGRWEIPDVTKLDLRSRRLIREYCWSPHLRHHVRK